VSGEDPSQGVPRRHLGLVDGEQARPQPAEELVDGARVEREAVVGLLGQLAEPRPDAAELRAGLAAQRGEGGLATVNAAQ
jgi:hypothetical protein